MNYKKIIEDYQKILTLCGDCQDSRKDEYIEFIRNIKASLKGKSFKDYSQYFSELFDIWLLASETERNINILPFDEALLDRKDKKYKEQTSIFPLLIQDEDAIAASRNQEPPNETYDPEKYDREKRVIKLLEFSSLSEINTLHETQAILEIVLSELWLHIFQGRLIFLSYEADKDKYKNSKIDKYFHKNWPLYELINQISRTIEEIIQEGEVQKRNFSNMYGDDKSSIVENTNKMCKYILETYILHPVKNMDTYEDWLPTLNSSKEINLPYIIATSDLVSYMFEYKLMPLKRKNSYLQKIKQNVENIYNHLMKDDILCSAIDSYIYENDKKDQDIIVRYKKHLLSPKTILVFIISVIQEVVRKSLTQSRNNIFFTIKGISRDTGLSEKSIMDKVKKDTKSYMLIFHYFDKPVSATIKSKEKKLNTWIEELNKLRYGVLDDYLFDLAQAAQISFEETTVTSIKTSKKLTLS